ncbi:MAG: hypothetical protein FRX49_10826 [Trebouxia sp. A1-2]|nr:MAG: hypothetical protein FRX49_10826 [Trebouxia sp. A1-2]
MAASSVVSHAAEPDVCGICLDTKGRHGGVTALQCGHSFCSGCASKSLAISDRCPFCRRSHNPSQVANQVKPYAHTASSGTHAVQDILDDVEASSQLSARARSPSARLPLGEDHSSTLTGSLWPRDTTGLAWGRQSLIDVIPARSEVQDSIQTLIARIESLNFRPGTAWDAQLSELRVIDLRLSLGLQEGQPNMRHFFQEHTQQLCIGFLAGLWIPGLHIRKLFPCSKDCLCRARETNERFCSKRSVQLAADMSDPSTAAAAVLSKLAGNMVRQASAARSEGKLLSDGSIHLRRRSEFANLSMPFRPSFARACTMSCKNAATQAHTSQAQRNPRVDTTGYTAQSIEQEKRRAWHGILMMGNSSHLSAQQRRSGSLGHTAAGQKLWLGRFCPACATQVECSIMATNPTQGRACDQQLAGIQGLQAPLQFTLTRRVAEEHPFACCLGHMWMFSGHNDGTAILD